SRVTSVNRPSVISNFIGSAGETPISPSLTGATSLGLMSSVMGLRSMATVPSDASDEEHPVNTIANKATRTIGPKTQPIGLRRPPIRISAPFQVPAHPLRADGFGSDRLPAHLDPPQRRDRSRPRPTFCQPCRSDPNRRASLPAPVAHLHIGFGLPFVTASSGSHRADPVSISLLRPGPVNVCPAPHDGARAISSIGRAADS